MWHFQGEILCHTQGRRTNIAHGVCSLHFRSSLWLRLLCCSPRVEEQQHHQQVGDNLYRITLTFSVSSKAYSQVYQYLRDYAPDHKGHLTGFQEQVQDVSDDYIDTSSQLTNLKKEQERVQVLMGQAKTLNDT